jgi:hypothetical protein
MSITRRLPLSEEYSDDDFSLRARLNLILKPFLNPVGEDREKVARPILPHCSSKPWVDKYTAVEKCQNIVPGNSKYGATY